MKLPARAGLIVSMGVAGALLSGCGSSTSVAAVPTSTSITVLAASSLTGVVTELVTQFEADNPGTKVTTSFGSSATLAQQVVNGAPADVLLTASPGSIKPVVDAKLTTSTPIVFARNTITLVVSKKSTATITGLASLNSASVTWVMCAETVPCGKAGRTALDAAGVTTKPASFEQDVKATLTKVKLGEADAGLVYVTDAKAAAADVTEIALSGKQAATTDYPGAVLTTSTNQSVANAFLALLTGDKGKAALSGAGFTIP